jgi:hypothetical protein
MCDAGNSGLAENTMGLSRRRDARIRPRQNHMLPSRMIGVKHDVGRLAVAELHDMTSVVPLDSHDPNVPDRDYLGDERMR